MISQMNHGLFAKISLYMQEHRLKPFRAAFFVCVGPCVFIPSARGQAAALSVDEALKTVAESLVTETPVVAMYASGDNSYLTRSDIRVDPSSCSVAFHAVVTFKSRDKHPKSPSNDGVQGAADCLYDIRGRSESSYKVTLAKDVHLYLVGGSGQDPALGPIWRQWRGGYENGYTDEVKAKAAAAALNRAAALCDDGATEAF